MNFVKILYSKPYFCYFGETIGFRVNTKAFPVTGIILAGGKSSRMGTEKGLLSINGKKMVERVAEAISAITDQCIIVSNTADYQFLNRPVYPDVYPDTGPLGGIYTGLLHTQTDWNLVVACDMPLVTGVLLEKILQHTAGALLVVPRVNGQIQPLCAGYHRGIREKLHHCILEQTFTMQQVIRQFGDAVCIVDCSGTQEEKNFVNINTPAELEQIKQHYEN